MPDSTDSSVAPDSGLVLADHLSARGVFDHYRRTIGGTERTHWQVIYLKSQGKEIAQIADVTGYSERWILSVIARYNAHGPNALIDTPEATLVSSAHHRDLQRQSKELDTARKAQQEILAVSIPDHPDLEVAAFQRSAYELGGDYFDFHMGQSGALTVAVGDATGHGTRAGMMVIATKSLFTAFVEQDDLIELVRQLSQTLKKVNLRATYMHLTLGRYHDGQLDLVVAGMPPVLVYRAASGKVEEIVVKGVPLGSFVDFPYAVHAVEMAPGDTALLVSDGLTELVSPSGEMLSIERVREIFEEVAPRSADRIIRRLRKAGLAWRAESPLKDDVTLVVLKRRSS